MPSKQQSDGLAARIRSAEVDAPAREAARNKEALYASQWRRPVRHESTKTLDAYVLRSRTADPRGQTDRAERKRQNSTTTPEDADTCLSG